MLFYHVNRKTDFEINDVLNYLSLPKNSNPELVDYCNKHFPEGLSQMGYKYSSYINPNSVEYSSYTSEVILEIFRQKSFPNLPSRFQSVFCSSSIEEATFWYKQLKLKSANILVFESDNFYKFDAAWRDIIAANLSMFSVEMFANNYWNGKIFEKSPRIEYLLPLPLKISDILSIN